MTLPTHEGVIKFQLDFQEGPSPPEKLLHELNAWRNIFRQLGLIGQDPERYDGYGFGNLSRRLPGRDGAAFLISGTQTGHLPVLRADHYATVHQCNPATNQLQASGQTQPSSEALSHGVLYQSNPGIDWVMHLHCPEIFDNCMPLKLPYTSPDADYGTPEMAAEIQRVADDRSDLTARLLVMSGHQDGILVYGSSAAETGSLAITTLALARQPS